MMRVKNFTSSLMLGGVAAVAVVFAQHVFAPIVGAGNVLALYLAASLVLYTVFLGRGLRQRIRNALVAGLGSMLVLGLASGIDGVAIGLSLVLAFIRTGLDAEARTPRGLIAEGVLGVGALAFSSALAFPGWLGHAAGLWGFALVQSLHFLLPLAAAPRVRRTAGDPFENARERLLVLLEDA